MISPCVAFNNHAGSTKSFDYVREHNEAVNRLDFMTGARADHRRLRAGQRCEVVEQHDGTMLRLRKIAADYEPTDRVGGAELSCSITPPRARSSPGCSMSIPTPKICTPTSTPWTTPLNQLSEKELCPGAAALEKINASLR